jgi:hypothetical protein
MAETKEPPTVDPDNIPETLCVGRFNISPGPGPLVTLTFTNVRKQATPLFDRNAFVAESVVRARIVTTTDNIKALRDMLVRVVQDTGMAPASGGGATKLH